MCITSNNNFPKIISQGLEATAITLQLLFNNVLSNNEFPENLTLADITQVLKKKDPL